MPCRNCGREPANRPRGLCMTCYYDRRIRERWPPLGWDGQGSGIGVGLWSVPAPDVPTDVRQAVAWTFGEEEMSYAPEQQT